MTEACSTEARIELARLDERIKGLQREIAHAEVASASALKLASDELARRLENLNHAHQQAVEVQATYLPREVFEASLKEVLARSEATTREMQARLQSVENEMRDQRGKLWLPMIVVAAMAAGLGAAAVKFLIR